MGTSRSKTKDVGISMKGMLYSVMITLMLIPILALIIFYSHSSQIRDIDIDIRANELEYFTKSVERDLLRFIEINGKRSLISAVSKVVTNGTGLDDAQLRLGEMIKNGTLYGEPAPLVDISNLETWEEKVENITSSAGFNIEFKDVQINIAQNDSFNVSFDVNMTINISDKTEVMGIVKNITASVLVSIEGIEDPLSPLNTLGRIVRFIKISNVSKNTTALVIGLNASGIGVSGEAFVKSDFQGSDANSSRILVTNSIAGKESDASGFAGVVSEGDVIIPPGFSKTIISGATGATSTIANGTKIYLDQTTKKVWDLSNLTSDIRNGYYHNSSVGASFLDRLEGNITLSPKYKYGIETFVYLPDLTAENLEIDSSASCVDYQYWRGIAGNDIRNGDYDLVFTWFKIDEESAKEYGINELRT